MSTETAKLPERESLFKTACKISWAGQMVASCCWIASVFLYGMSSTADVMQLLAATAWTIANLAALWETQQNVAS